MQTLAFGKKTKYLLLPFDGTGFGVHRGRWHRPQGEPVGTAGSAPALLDEREVMSFPEAPLAAGARRGKIRDNCSKMLRPKRLRTRRFPVSS